MNASLEVDRGELKSGIATIRRTTSSGDRGDAVLEFKDGSLFIHCGGVSVEAKASGEWEGRARVPSSFLIRADRALPAEDPLRVAIKGEKLHLGTLKVTCTWDISGRPLIQIPMNPNLKSLLKISRCYDQATIEGSGLTEMVSEAEDQLQDKLKWASRTLAPVGISRQDLEDLVEKKIGSSQEPEALIGPDQQRLPLSLDGDQLILGDD